MQSLLIWAGASAYALFVCWLGVKGAEWADQTRWRAFTVIVGMVLLIVGEFVLMAHH